MSTTIASKQKAIQFGQRVLNFWFSNGRWSSKTPPPKYEPVDENVQKSWFMSSKDYDEEIRKEFENDIQLTANDYYQVLYMDNDHLKQHPEHTLACIICLDQFPRNIYRSTPKAFSYDRKAKELSMIMIKYNVDKQLPYIEQGFVYLPFQHSEILEDHDLSVKYCENVLDEGKNDEHLTDDVYDYLKNFLEFAKQHRDIIQKFGRFPHRNLILNRIATDDEDNYLKMERLKIHTKGREGTTVKVTFGDVHNRDTIIQTGLQFDHINIPAEAARYNNKPV
ncbi:unnamed protein product [Didymodactylos carnosus]|uniref:Uncharacterized protein n=1 Tax=Didymodactylos carnosus TaxID=1234261 RepID=A0A813ZBJ7_9BILA|nr:unnamed protein product [Didymodactylos carnosus]CAF3679272.1 unnamed protein product [Didymodactylos carnosus]